MMNPAQARFVNALDRLEEDKVLDRAILISASSLRILGIRVRTYFIDLLVQKSYYSRKVAETKFVSDYELEPVPLRLAGFPMRLGTVDGDLCSFRHLIKPYNIYEEVEFRLGKQIRLIKIRPHNYVRKDCDEALGRMVQRFDKGYWQDFYSYHNQIEAIDLGMRREELRFGPERFLKFDETA